MLCYIYILYVNSCPYVEVQTFTVSLNIFLFQILMDLFQDRNQTLSLYTRLEFFKLKKKGAFILKTNHHKSIDRNVHLLSVSIYFCLAT